jgi:hypothetical protein
MGDRHERLCLVRGHVPQLRRSSRNRPASSGGRLHQRLPAPSEALLEGLIKLQHKIEGEKAFEDQKKELREVFS